MIAKIIIINTEYLILGGFSGNIDLESIFLYKKIKAEEEITPSGKMLVLPTSI
jgi:hypothetical protein